MRTSFRARGRVTLGPGGLSERFTAPDGKPITIAIGAPRIDSTYDVPPIQSDEDPSVYFANAIAEAGPHKTIRSPRGGVYDFPAATCERLGAHLKINAAADALHITNSGGDILIENNVFAYQGDDGLNINAMTFPIAATGTNQISVPANHAYIRTGDVVALFNSEMRFDDSASWRIAGITSNPADHSNTLTLDHPIPTSDRNGFLVDPNFFGARYVVRNNQFLHNRARGALLQTPYGLVEANTFSGQTMYPLLLTTFPPEGPGAQNLLIAHNQISDSGVGGGPGAIIIARQRMVYSALAHNPPAQQNLIFVDNLIHDVPGPAFYISSANAAALYRNTLKNTNHQTTDNKWNGAGDINSPIVINDASNILLLHNTISGGRPISVDRTTTTGVGNLAEGAHQP
jgi:hypothetical protein